MHPSVLLLFGLALFFSCLGSLSAHQPSAHNHLKTRASGDDQKNGVSKNCTTYYSANTPHAVCNGDRSIMCHGGCTGGVVAQNCQLNSSSIPTTQTCSVAFSQTSETAYLCNTPQGAYTCLGPQQGSVYCNNCVSTPQNLLSANSTTASGSSPSNSTNEHDPQDSSSNPAIMNLPGFLIFFVSVAVSTLLKPN